MSPSPSAELPSPSPFLPHPFSHTLPSVPVLAPGTPSFIAIAITISRCERAAFSHSRQPDSSVRRTANNDKYRHYLPSFLHSSGAGYRLVPSPVNSLPVLWEPRNSIARWRLLTTIARAVERYDGNIQRRLFPPPPPPPLPLLVLEGPARFPIPLSFPSKDCSDVIALPYLYVRSSLLRDFFISLESSCCRYLVSVIDKNLRSPSYERPAASSHSLTSFVN